MPTVQHLPLYHFCPWRLFGPSLRSSPTGGHHTDRQAQDWLDGGHFLVQTYETVFGDERAQTGIKYWFYDQAGKFRIIFFSNNGPFTEEGNRNEGAIAKRALTFVGPARFQYELDTDGKVKKNDDGTVTIRWWLSDEGRFQPWMTNVCNQVNTSPTRQAPASGARTQRRGRSSKR
jgi:hypothetical protein